MPPVNESISFIAPAIQLALTPSFLLTGIAGLLNVMSGRLTRIIDRARRLTEGPSGKPCSSLDDITRQELQLLEQRRRFTSIAITASTFAAFFICILVAMLFIEGMFNIPLDDVIGGLFTIAMLSLVTGLAYYLREVHLAMSSTRICDSYDD